MIERKPESKLENRAYQSLAVNAVLDELNSRGRKSTALVMATGLGKTVIFGQVALKFYVRTKKPVLVLAHRSELIEQARATLSGLGLRCAVEQADSYAMIEADANVIIGSVQTLSRRNRLEQFPPDYFSLIVTDECHHATCETYLKIYRHFQPAKHLGVTATPIRHDKVGLKNVFQSVAFQYDIAKGIKDGYLCNVVGKQVKVEGLCLEDLRIIDGDFSNAEMNALLMTDKILQKMVLPTIEHAENRQTIVFTQSVEHAHAIAKCFNRVPGKAKAIAVDGGMNEDARREAIQRFREKEIQFIINVGVLTEGFDYPPTACIALFRPTQSLGLLAQMIGRGTRKAKDKTDCLVLDFVGINNTVQTVNVLDVLDGTVLSGAEKMKAQELIEDGEDAVTALEKAKLDIAKLEQLQAKWKALSSANAFDVIKLFALPSAKGLYGGDLCTLMQRGLLENAGIKCPPTLEKGEASNLISEIIGRRESGLITFKQMKYLKRLGYKQENIGELTFAQACGLIDGLKKGAVSYVR